MRDATREELESVKKYIESISKPTNVNFFGFTPQFLGEWIPQIDCNDCRWLDLTENEQQELGDKCHRYHFCTYYKKRIYHETNNLIHNPVLIPCKECGKEKYEHYQSKNRE